MLFEKAAVGCRSFGSCRLCSHVDPAAHPFFLSLPGLSFLLRSFRRPDLFVLFVLSALFPAVPFSAVPSFAAPFFAVLGFPGSAFDLLFVFLISAYLRVP